MEAQLQVGVAVEVLRQTGFMVVAPFQAGFVVKVLLKLKSLCWVPMSELLKVVRIIFIHPFIEGVILIRLVLIVKNGK
jgi:hypothetical protein